jgi:hypothetical protein
VEALAYHTRNWEITYGQQTALEKQASGPFWVSRVVAEAAAEKVKYLLDPTLPPPDILQPELREFALAVRAAKPTQALGIEACTYYLPEVVGLSLAEYAAKEEAKRQVVVRVSQRTSEIKTTGHAEKLQHLTSKGAKVSMLHSNDTQGNRVSVVMVEYSVQQPPSQVKEISSVLDEAAKQPGHLVQEPEADRVQRQAFDQREAQQEQTRTRKQQPNLGMKRK